jgi:glycosyltransferase involved in cell wall biosynthesis
MKWSFVAYDGPGCWNGPNVNLRRLLPALQVLGDEVECWVLHHGSSPLARHLERHGVRCALEPWRDDTARHIAWIIKRLEEWIATSPGEARLFVPNSSVPAYYAARWARSRGVPSAGVLRAHDEFHRAVAEAFGDPASPWHLSGMACVDGRLEKLVAQKSGGQTPTVVVPSGVPLPPSVAPQELQGDEALRVAYVGRIQQEQKRVLDVTRELCESAARLPLSATLWGDGPQKREVQRLIAQSNQGARVRWAGPLAPEKLHETLRGQHAVVLLSDYEGTPGALMDGMSCGLVPVALDIPGGVRELVLHEETGLLLSSRQELPDALARLRENSELRQKLARNARRHIEKSFSLPLAVARWREFAARLVEKEAPEKEQPISLEQLLSELPPVHPAMAREDERPANANWQRDVRRVVMQKARAIKHFSK